MEDDLLRPAVVEVHVVHHCNLNCRGCAHFAPLADPWFITEAQLRAGLAALKYAGVHPRALRVFGGEPLLHPDLGRLLVVSRRLLPDTELRVLTNGTLPGRLRRLAPVLRDTGTVVERTVYPTVDQAACTAVDQLLAAVGVRTVVEHDARCMRRHRLSASPAADASLGRCVMTAGEGSPQLTMDPPRLWMCPVQAYAWIARGRFTDVPAPAPDCWVDLLNADGERLRGLLAGRPTSFCRHCAVSADDLPWAPSAKLRSEW